MVRVLIAALAALLVVAAPAAGVVGGKGVRDGDYPWFAHVGGCGGSLVAPDRVLTSAHCTTDSEDLEAIRVGGVRRRGVRFAMAPGWEKLNGDNHLHDVAVILLDEPVTGVTPARLWPAGRLLPKREKLLGRGLTSYARGGVPSGKATQTVLAPLGESECARRLSKVPHRARQERYRKFMVCALDPDRRRPFRSGCDGDSGGALYTGSRLKPTLIGVTSWVGKDRCGTDGLPTVAAEPSRYPALFAAEPAWAPAATAAAAVSGGSHAGDALRCDVPGWDVAPTELEYKWVRLTSGGSRDVARTQTYVARDADAGHVLICNVRASNAGGRIVLTPGASSSVRITSAGQARKAAAAQSTFQTDEARNYAAAFGRQQMWLGDPGYAASPGQDDPARDISRWAPERGKVLAVSWHNRYGARISGHLFAPKQSTGRLPAAIVVSGADAGEAEYWWIAEDLAEHGYLALTFDPQGQGASDVAPAPRYCDTSGDWRKPQELGMQEQGSCAGEDPQDTAISSNAAQVEFIAQARTDHVDPEAIGPTYRAIAPRFVLGAFDATAWLLSAQNPWRATVDRRRLAIVGHSAGAYAANMVGNGDPQQRFRAAVAMDAYYANDHGVVPRVPTLILQSEQESFLGPHASPPPEPRSPETLHPTRATFEQFPHAAVDAAFLVPAASSHPDFTDGVQPASFLGQRTSALALLAWLDEYVAGKPGLPRLLARTADTTADVSSIGTGHPTIAGRSHEQLLSGLYPSDVAVSGRSCLDLKRSACDPPPPCTPTAAVSVRRRAVTATVRLTWRDACGRVHLVSAGAGRSSARALAGPADALELHPRVPRRRHLRVRIDGRVVRRA